MILLFVTMLILHHLFTSCAEFSTEASYWMAKMAPSTHSPDDLMILPPDPTSGCEFARSTTEPWIYASRNTCRTFPKYYDIGPDIEKLQIKSTAIVAIKRGDLFKMAHLTSMSIDMNDKLQVIEGGVFANMSRMSNLSISNNYNLKALRPDVFQGLTNLVQLTLAKTNILTISSVAVATSHLTKLASLDIGENLLNNIQESDLEPMKGNNLKTLKINYCQLGYIHPKAFDVLVSLESLNLGQNYLNTTVVTELLANVVRSSTNFTDLNLDQLPLDSKPTSLLQIIAESNVTRLSLKRLPLEPLASGFFPVMPNLATLDLSEILATNIATNTFNSSTFPNLTTLILSKNNLEGIMPGVVLPQIVNLDVSSNSGDDNRATKFTVQPKSFSAMRKIQFLNLSYNRVMFVYNYTFDGLVSLKVLLLANASIFRLDDYSFSTMKQLTVLDLKNNIFPVYYNLTSKTFYGLDNLQLLNLESCGLTNIPNGVFRPMENLTYLILRSNRIVTLSTDFMYTNLNTLDVSINTLIPWNTRWFNSSKLSVIYLTNNQLTYLTQSMLEDLSTIDSVNVKDNPFACDCKMMRRIKGFSNVSNKVRHFGAKCFSPIKWENVPLDMFFVEDNFACEVNRLFLVPVLLLAAIVLLCVIFITYYYRSRVYYWWFITRVKLKVKSSLRGQVNYQYDAFVSYSSDDRNFVVRLVAMLENCEPFLKLCVYERDFQIGDLISETVMQSVAVSRRIILVVSDSFAKSQWCKWETQIAQHRQLFLEGEGETCDPLVLIKLGGVLSTHMTPALRYLMKTRVFLEWDSEPVKQRLFWEKLRTTLLPAISRKDLNLE